VARTTATATRINNVADARRLARRTVPRAVFDYIDGGAEDEVTMAENERAFREIAFRPRMAVKVEHPRLETTVLGTDISMPVLLAPCGLASLMHPDGALGIARAAKRAGTVSVLSTVAGTAPEALRSEPGPRWFQLYAADREIAHVLMSRAAASGFDALVVTVDTPALGKRERDLRNGVTIGFNMDARTLARLGPQVLARPGWALRMLRTSARTLGRMPVPGRTGERETSEEPKADTERESKEDIRRPTKEEIPRDDGAPEPEDVSVGTPTGAVSSAGAVSMLASPFTWDDIKWIRDRWSGPLLVKGILSGDDGKLAADAGADAVIVSNHGGRQLEGAPATLRVLPEVVEAAPGRLEVLVDGGVRRGGDVLKALALGARAVLIGRPYLYALAASGQAGVERILDVFRVDMMRSMALMGCGSVTQLDPSWVRS
jgi:isopentenyl diphosphate isomerase/L-lactate dehydrogenase-like FMN-dependent dehydrogenase